MRTMEPHSDVDFIFAELREEMTAAHARAVRRLAALGLTIDSSVADELEAEALELREWVGRVRAAAGFAVTVDDTGVDGGDYTTENPSDRP